ncbi:MAG: methyl-accepting chemotaxis protein [Oscillospiraceae bacterium]|nr:methyl-accepting chemotaxis protein [Oscillospiraceae bacterium]
MKNMKVRVKLLTGFIIVTAIGILLGTVGIVSTMTIKSRSEDISLLQETGKGVADVLNAHYKWRHELSEAALTGGDFTGSLNPDTCALGKWLSGDQAKGVTDTTVLSLLGRIESPHHLIHTEAEATVAMIKAGNLDEARTDLAEHIFPETQKVIDLLTEISQRFDQLIEEGNQNILSVENGFVAVIIALIIAASAISVYMAIYISNMISKPLLPMGDFFEKAGTTGDISLGEIEKEAIAKYSQYGDELGQLTRSAVKFVSKITDVSQVLERVAAGNLDNDVSVLSDKDNMGVSLNDMMNSLNQMFEDINASAAQVSIGSKQVADGAQSLAQGSTEQAASVEELSSSIGEIAAKTKENSEMANKTAKLADTIRGNAEKGSRQMDEMITAMDEINHASQSIGKIINVINDISFQTNILALNAAVEAARAGQHGKGFAVVAEEVRNLATKSAEAAKDTETMIQDSIKKAELGANIAGETSISLTEIVSGINQSSQLIDDIAKSSEEQSQGISQINIGIDQVAQVVQQNSATAQQSAAASEEMSSQSAMLSESIKRFKLKRRR